MPFLNQAISNPKRSAMPRFEHSQRTSLAVRPCQMSKHLLPSKKPAPAPIKLPDPESHPQTRLEEFQHIVLYKTPSAMFPGTQLDAFYSKAKRNISYDDQLVTMAMLFEHQQATLRRYVSALKAELAAIEATLDEEAKNGVKQGPLLFDEEIWGDIKRYVKTRCRAERTLDVLKE